MVGASGGKYETRHDHAAAERSKSAANHIAELGEVEA